MSGITWQGAEDAIGDVVVGDDRRGEGTGKPRKGRGLMTHGYKHTGFWTPAAEPTPATRYMRMHSMDNGCPTLAFWDQSDASLETPELNLMMQVLTEAVKDFHKHWNCKPGNPKYQIFQEAYRWIWDSSPQARDWPYSFGNICNALGIDGEDFRRRLGVQLAAQRARRLKLSKGHSRANTALTAPQ